MEHTKYRSAEPNRGRVHRRVRRGQLAGAAVAVGAMVAVTLPMLSSEAAVGGRRSIEVTTTSDLVILEGYPNRTDVRIMAFRKGVKIASATKRVRNNEIVLNHGGGTDCWESARTPNLRPGDTIRTRIIGTRTVDSMVVRGLFIDDVARDNTANTVTVSGHVNLTGRTGVPAGPLELRVRTDSDDRQNIRGDVADDGTWGPIEVPVAANQAAGAEVVLEWIGGGAGELTVAEEDGPALRLPGCPRVEAN
jgi:hypothetical protein